MDSDLAAAAGAQTGGSLRREMSEERPAAGLLRREMSEGKPSASLPTSPARRKKKDKPPKRRGKLPPFPRLGVRLEELERLAAKCPEGATTNLLCHEIVRQLTVPSAWRDVAAVSDAAKGWYSHQYEQPSKPGKMHSNAPKGTRSYAELLQGDAETRPLAGAATHFVSHAWSFIFGDVVAALRAFEDVQEPGVARFYWFDVLSVNQHTGQTLPQEWWGTTFKDAIHTIGHTVMVLAPWRLPKPLTRAWCLWEIFCTVDTGAVFSVCLAPRERVDFELALAENFSVVQSSFAKIRAEDSEASVAADRDMIFGHVRAMAGGFVTIDAMTMSRMRDWFEAAALEAVQRARDAQGVLRDSAYGLADGVANLLKQHGKYKQASNLASEVLTARARLLGPDHAKTLESKSTLCSIMCIQGQQKQAHKMQEEILATMRRDSEGVCTESILKETAQLATIVSEFDEVRGRALCAEVLQGYAERGEPEASAALSVRIQLASLVSDAEPARATALFQDAIAALTAKHGPHHVDTLKAQRGLAQHFSELDKLEQAREIYELVIAGNTAKLGHDHPSTLNARTDLGQFFETHLEDYGAARTIYEEVVAGLTLKLGAGHVDTLRAKVDMADIMKAQDDMRGAQGLYESVVAQLTTVLGRPLQWHAHRLRGLGGGRLVGSVLAFSLQTAAKH